MMHLDAIDAFTLPLPKDGGHRALVQAAHGAGLPFDVEEADEVVAECRLLQAFEPTMTYRVDFGADLHRRIPRIAHRLRACARLIRQGHGAVPGYAREKLERLRDLSRDLAHTLDELLDSRPEGE